MSIKVCKYCNEEKNNLLFRKNRNQCLECYKEYLKQYRVKNKILLKKKRLEYCDSNSDLVKNSCKKYYMKNKEKFSASRKEYYSSHKEELINYAKLYREEHDEDLKRWHKEYYEKNKEEIIKKKIEYQNYRYKNDPEYRIRSLVSRSVNRMLKINNSSKRGGSVKDNLPYTIDELKNHLESQFEVWMNWNNQGKYNSKLWDDEDQSTWTWQIDHIIPQSKLPYTSMEDENFKKCWALKNLRPLSAKQNLLKSNRK